LTILERVSSGLRAAFTEAAMLGEDRSRACGTRAKSDTN
jgi:hypothetical protein